MVDSCRYYRHPPTPRFLQGVGPGPGAPSEGDTGGEGVRAPVASAGDQPGLGVPGPPDRQRGQLSRRNHLTYNTPPALHNNLSSCRNIVARLFAIISRLLAIISRLLAIFTRLLAIITRLLAIIPRLLAIIPRLSPTTTHPAPLAAVPQQTLHLGEVVLAVAARHQEGCMSVDIRRLAVVMITDEKHHQDHCRL